MVADKMIIFDLEGRFAHFRKFYTNSSSLSYAFPPRTTITGIIAGILGMERDSYYKVFSTNECMIALSIRAPVRKIVQTINYIRTKNIKEVTASGGHTQIPLEFVLPDLAFDFLKYRIYFWHKSSQLMGEFSKLICKNSFIYPPYLGITECIGNINFVAEAKFEIISNKDNQKLKVSTVIQAEKIKEESLELNDEYKFMKEDRMPIEFNEDRRIKKVGSFIYEKSCKPIIFKIKEGAFKVSYKENERDIDECGIFIE